MDGSDRSAENQTRWTEAVTGDIERILQVLAFEGEFGVAT